MQQLFTLVASVAVSYAAMKWIKGKLDPYRDDKKQVPLMRSAGTMPSVT